MSAVHRHGHDCRSDVSTNENRRTLTERSGMIKKNDICICMCMCVNIYECMYK